ncbi:C6 finger domain protein, putative [Talaromyces stipitatus ATCC 10500]|uniref:C6 finger domain protein, putative n=1 Tax=Talaromyces stipitatus (strain ATCC 10500 / CBS 375.48 / QM 6759 / NRRL 1006) TaxID=441959 RepID=B8MBI4_TALSN|nr:C6 finger domain protein, putative [Talaromyces stipitatus ATCC 10500]EED17848.1 C6 finger domain protein, putative [Talaromyces stipitatus ATCC 10500]
MENQDSYNKSNKTTRRSHRKSRAGCGNCKKRRIKCDEKKPVCSNCTGRALECTFSIDNVETSISTYLPETTARFRPYTFSHNNLKDIEKKGASSFEAEYQSVSTHSIGIQCNLDAPSANKQHISLDDLQLFHHFIVSTYNTISDDTGSCDLWQIHVPQWGMNVPSIHHLILALSSLHLSHKFPNRRDEYVRKADDHFTFGLQSVTAVLAYLDSRTSQQIYISTVLICFVYFARGPRTGEYLVFGDYGQSEWRVLMRGVKSIVESHRSEVFTGDLAPNSQSMTVSVNPLLRKNETDSYLEHLQEMRTLIQQELPSDTDRAMYNSVIDDLLAVRAEVNIKRSIQWPPVGLMQVLIGWVYRIPDEFVNRLEQKESMALVVLAYWAMLLKYMRSVWFMKGWDVHVMEGISASLQKEFHGWIQWPLQQLEKD